MCYPGFRFISKKQNLVKSHVNLSYYYYASAP